GVRDDRDDRPIVARFLLRCVRHGVRRESRRRARSHRRSPRPVPRPERLLPPPTAGWQSSGRRGRSVGGPPPLRLQPSLQLLQWTLRWCFERDQLPSPAAVRELRSPSQSRRTGGTLPCRIVARRDGSCPSNQSTL